MDLAQNLFFLAGVFTGSFLGRLYTLARDALRERRADRSI